MEVNNLSFYFSSRRTNEKGSIPGAHFPPKLLTGCLWNDRFKQFVLLQTALTRQQFSESLQSATSSRRGGGWGWGERLSGWGPLARLAGPSCVSVCLEWWWYELMILLCGLLPDPKPTVAAMGVLIQTTALVYVFPSSLGFGVSTRVGNELGANRPARARAAAATAVGLAALTGLGALGFAAGVRERWGRMFTADADILRLTAAALPIVGLCELGNCPQTVGCGVLRGTARPAHAAQVNLGAFYLVGAPVAVGLGFGLGVGFCGLWMGLLAAQVCCAGLMLYVVWTTDWDAQARRAQLLTSAPAPAPAPAPDVEKAGAMLIGPEPQEGGDKVSCYQPLISIRTVVEIERG
ncbi:protein DETOXIFICATION 51-like [Ananas comosus]|uniref:Protein DETOXIFICATION 51-like n=1 Tax=Ananas comosus TaxID=4615 RepID=A0A6P5FKG8_ANACO|nr:protein DETOXIFICATION 51-like [Ananas comosus]